MQASYACTCRYMLTVHVWIECVWVSAIPVHLLNTQKNTFPSSGTVYSNYCSAGFKTGQQPQFVIYALVTEWLLPISTISTLIMHYQLVSHAMNWHTISMGSLLPTESRLYYRRFLDHTINSTPLNARSVKTWAWTRTVNAELRYQPKKFGWTWKLAGAMRTGRCGQDIHIISIRQQIIHHIQKYHIQYVLHLCWTLSDDLEISNVHSKKTLGKKI